MSRNFLSQLTKAEQARLLEDLNYMNLEEIRGFCFARGIPYRIVAEYPNGKVKATKDTDRKPIVLARVRRYLTTGDVGLPTCIPANIVREEKPPARLGRRDRLYYRWYAKEHEGVIRLLGELTAGRFRDGAVARVVAMEFWTRGEAPTLEAFARSWTKAKAEQPRLLTDRGHNAATSANEATAHAMKTTVRSHGARPLAYSLTIRHDGANSGLSPCSSNNATPETVVAPMAT